VISLTELALRPRRLPGLPVPNRPSITSGRQFESPTEDDYNVNPYRQSFIPGDNEQLNFSRQSSGLGDEESDTFYDAEEELDQSLQFTPLDKLGEAPSASVL
jgi:hypothetical protein